MSMSVDFHRDGKPYTAKMGLYAHAIARHGDGWVTIETANGDSVALHDLTAREMDALGRAIRYAAAKLETLAKQRRIDPAGSMQEQIEAKDDFEMADYGGES